MVQLKQNLYNFCLDYVKQRIDVSYSAIQTAQASANEETKSSAGDKYETGRAMMQLEIEKNTIQLNEARKLRQVLDQFDPLKPTSFVQVGSLVFTSFQSYYISISAGQLTVANKIYFAISPASPIGIQLMGKRAGERFVFNGKSIDIQQLI